MDKEWFTEHKCHICGKTFVTSNAEKWAYKKVYWKNVKTGQKKTIYFCSWKCFRQHELEDAK